MKPKNQRLVLVAAAVAAVLLAVLLAMWGLKDRAAYFYTPADIAAGKAAESPAIRLGGMVERGSIQRGPDGVTIRFVVTDGKAATPVLYRGIVPDLFREGSGAVAEGRLQGGIFVADTILAKHDERYMPPQMANEVAGR
jgi:cytochrome c-type biogenesis protein CcmE